MDAFDGPMLTREDDREDYGEQRYVAWDERTAGSWCCYGQIAWKESD